MSQDLARGHQTRRPPGRKLQKGPPTAKSPGEGDGILLTLANSGKNGEHFKGPTELTILLQNFEKLWGGGTRPG